MNKYSLNQIVYFPTIWGGELSIIAMQITKIEQDKFGIYYTGELTDHDEMPEVRREDKLFLSQEMVINHIETQLEVLRGKS